LTQEPPPLPQASRKRILPAFLLCFVLCAHRIYAGKYITGIVQIAWIVGGFVWLEMTCSGLLAIINSGTPSLEMLEHVSDWEQKNGIPYAPMIALIAVGIWIAVDAAQLLAKKFTDGEGHKITHWL
jgi:hypothetical protein